jgi:phage-related protein
MDWQLVFYPDKGGNEPVKEFILGQDYKARAEIIHVFDLLYKFNITLGLPYVRKINKSGLRELRIKHGSDIYRIFFFAFAGRKFVLLHAIRKKDEKIPKSDKQLAIERMAEYKSRFEEV